MIYFAKPALTGALYIVEKEEFSVTRCKCDTSPWQKAKHIHKRQTHLLVRENYDHKGSVKEISGHEPRGAWRQEEVISCKPPVVK
jgi:hypothetical protein